MHIYIIRHAWAYEHGDPRWPDDSQRPLEQEGAERFARVVELLTQRGFAPDAIATSPYVRCRQTAEIVAAHSTQSPQLVELAGLKPGSDFAELIEWTKQQRVESVAWVGHAPDVTWLAASLISEGDAMIRFAKGAVASIRVEGPLGAGCGELQWHATAKLLGV
jgi:phosphohistidine phosphatase